MMARKRMRFEDESFTIEHRGMTATVKGLSGWRMLTGKSCSTPRAHAAMPRPRSTGLTRSGKARTGNPSHPKKLRLSQVEASRLTGGGHNAFSRYERGEVTPLPAVRNLFHLLDNHPDLLKELTE
jgi:HTH-type transcriptional regulator / antitoxin MqsA